MSDICAEFREKLITARRIRGISQQDLARRSGISVSAIKHIESGKSNPSVDTLIHIADVLGFDLKLVKR